MKLLIYVFAFFSVMYCSDIFALELKPASTTTSLDSCVVANNRGDNSIVIPGAQVFYNDEIHVIATDGATLDTSSGSFQSFYYYPILLPAGSSIKSVTAYVHLDEDRRTSIQLTLERRLLSEISSGETLSFSTGSNGYNALSYKTINADAGMNCIALDGKGGEIIIEAEYAYYLFLQIETANTSNTVGQIKISGLRINY